LVFSLFGKKPPKNETPLVRKVEERQKALREQAAKSAPRPEPPPPPAEAEADLDFTQFVPAGSPSPSAPPAADPSVPPASQAPVSVAPPSVSPAPSMAASQGLDFSSLLTPAGGAVSQGPAPSAPPSLAPQKEQPKRKAGKAPVDSVLCIEVEEGGGHDIPPPIEEGAVLFANGQAEEALLRMREALVTEPLGAWKLQVWLMIFDLLQHLERRAEFEELALEFAVHFERSPPLWVDPPPKAPASAAGRAAANIVLSGMLGAQSAGAFEQLEKSADKQAKLKLDFARIQGVEPEGAKLLLATLKHLRAAKKEFVLAGEAQLVKALREKAVVADATVDQAVWHLLLDIYQQLGQMNEFEEAAVDFAVTYEVSPPSYDPAAVKKRLSTGTTQMLETLPAAVDPDDDGAFRIAGEVAGQNDALFADLGAYAAQANPVLIDMKRTRRIDFINAGRLLNVLEKLKAEGKPIVVRGVGEMIVALFAVMGIPKVARIIPRK
jgi:anti-anti-sigma regulatory factor